MARGDSLYREIHRNLRKLKKIRLIMGRCNLEGCSGGKKYGGKSWFQTKAEIKTLR